MTKQHYIISYDISNHSLRNKMAKLLIRHGCERVQKSVFLAANINKEELMQMKAEAKQLMQQHSAYRPTDSLICFSIQKQSIPDMLWEGNTMELKRILEEKLFVLI